MVFIEPEPPHGAVDDLAGVFRAFFGQVKIDHGGFQFAVAHVSLDNSWIDAGLQKMGSIAVAQRMNGDAPFGDTGGEPGPSKSALHAGYGHWLRSIRRLNVSSAQSREDEGGIPVRPPNSGGADDMFPAAGEHTGPWRPCRDGRGSSSSCRRYQ